MKKSIKPFAVELRRTGKTVKSLPAKHPDNIVEAKPVASVGVEWPPTNDQPVSEARRAADRLFVASTKAPDIATRPVPENSDGRRVLPSLDEPDFIARMLQEEEANRPRRGRKPGSGLAPVRRPPLPAQTQDKALAAPQRPMLVLPKTIAGYVRGRIYARYAKRSEPVLGQVWRKSLKPVW